MHMPEFPDTQDKEPKAPISLTRVGVSGVKKLLKIKRENKRPIILLPTFDAFVDLPSTQKGVHMSRNPEAISEIIDEAADQSVMHMEDICANLVKRLLEKHEYAVTAETEAKSEYIINKYSPVTHKKTQETTHIISRAIANKDEKGNITVRKMIGAQVIGMTVCPCAQESVEQESKEKLLEFLDEETTEKVLNAVTFASHNQRGIGTIMIEVSEKQNVNVDDLITIIQNSMSSPVCEILKRPDENKIVTNAHKNPVFVEDCVRNMVLGILDKYSDLPDNSMVTIKQINEESIHQHNAYAEKLASIGELKIENEIGGYIMEVMELSRPIMEKMDAFQGCKPVVHSTESMIVRGKTHNKIKPENMYPRLMELFDELNIKKIEKGSEKARNFTDKVDLVLRKTEEVYDESNGIDGIEKLKNTFEITGFDAEYAIGEIDDLVVYVVLYMDRSGFGPMFVETMVIRMDKSSD